MFKKLILKRKIKNMATINLSNFSKANTPRVAEMIGNISLILAFVASLPLCLTGVGVVVPAGIITASTYAVAGGAMIKTLSKLMGVKETESSL